MRKSSRNYSQLLWVGLGSFHGVGLSCSGLPVSEYSSVVTFQHALDNRQCGLLKNGLLLAIGLEHHVKCESLVLFARRLYILDRNLPSFRENINDDLMALRFFGVGERSAPEGHLHALGGGNIGVLFHNSNNLKTITSILALVLYNELETGSQASDLFL